jgi:hypothetical protein
MSIDLKGTDEAVRLDMASWYFVLELAHRYGWVPELPAFHNGGLSCTASDVYEPEHVWYACYMSAGDLEVSAADAHALADALERALPDVPDHDAMAHKPRAYPMPEAMVRILHDLPDDSIPTSDQYVRAYEWFSGQRKERLWQIIRVCRTGGITIS